jgi:alpha-beta hydrolase superfamily lysophospholipase
MFEKFFADPSFDFETRSLFGDIHYGAGDIGEMLTAVANVVDGDATSWVKEWRTLAERIQAIGDASLAAGHHVSARGAYLRAAVYYAASYVFVDGTDNPAPQLTELFAAHRDCFDKHVSLLDPPAIPIAVPYEGTELRGYLFVPADDDVARPTVILNNGSDAAFTFLWPGLGQPGLDRGYNVVIFDGPGQQSMLFQRDIPFRPDWEHVITPLVDFLSERPEVDESKIVLYGTSQGGYWVPRAAAFEHRLAAVVADPGVVDVSASWKKHIPQEMVALLEAENEEGFTKGMNYARSQWSPAMLQEVAWRAKPYGEQPSDYATFRTVEEYKLGDLVKQITAPMLITDPEDEQFWPGQSKELYEGLTGPKKIIPFTKAEGANMHIEPMGRALLEQRMYDWLDETLAV